MKGKERKSEWWEERRKKRWEGRRGGKKEARVKGMGGSRKERGILGHKGIMRRKGGRHERRIKAKIVERKREKRNVGGKKRRKIAMTKCMDTNRITITRSTNR